jgi:hypothetical protein
MPWIVLFWHAWLLKLLTRIRTCRRHEGKSSAEAPRKGVNEVMDNLSKPDKARAVGHVHQSGLQHVTYIEGGKRWEEWMIFEVVKAARMLGGA